MPLCIKQFFNFNRCSCSGRSLPALLSTPGSMMLSKFLQNHKNDNLVEVQLIDTNPQYTNICYRDGRESSASLSDLSPCRQKLHSSEIESQLPILNEEGP